MNKGSTTISDEFGPPPGRLHDAVWRWHFYAAFLVVPFVILQAITGSVYLFKPQLDPLWQHSDAAPGLDLLRVSGDGTARLSDYWAEKPLVLIFGSYT